jgi:hypothetical protein
MNKKTFKMRNVVATAICLAGMTMISSCNNYSSIDTNSQSVTTRSTENDVSKMTGAYAGKYSWTNLTQDWSLSSTPTIEFKDGKYAYQGLSNDDFYDSGTGNFTVKGNKIIFELTSFPTPMQTIGVIDSWQLNGEYEYKMDGNNLTFSKTATLLDDEYKYEFVLKKASH